MIEDTIVYLILHAPFLLTLIWLSKTELKCMFTKVLIMTLSVIHLITITAYILKLGDDFAILSYWSMYLILPASVIYLKADEPKENIKLRFSLFALLGLPILGFIGILVAITLYSPSPH
jgi:hypothetical protein